MAITKTIEIDGQEVPFKASAALSRIYRARYGRDILKDFNSIIDEMDGEQPDISNLSIPTLECFEEIAYTMAKYADPTIPERIDDWLERFNMFSIYTILPQLVELWGLNIRTEAESKKNLEQVTAR